MIKERIIIQKEVPDPPHHQPGAERLEQYGWLVRPLVNVSTGLLLLRLMLGAVFIAHGGQKVLGWAGGPGLEGTVGFMGSLGVPAEMAYTVAFVEFFGGILLVLGLLSRLAAAGILAVMGGAIALVHLKAGFFAPEGFEYPLTLAVMALVLLLSGPGRYSLDALISAPRQRRPASGKVIPKTRVIHRNVEQ